jgi:hypothetical protein
MEHYENKELWRIGDDNGDAIYSSSRFFLLKSLPISYVSPPYVWSISLHLLLVMAALTPVRKSVRQTMVPKVEKVYCVHRLADDNCT